MDTIAERLTWALEKSDIPSIRSFHRQIEDRGLHEGTYSTVHRYFAGEVKEPPLAFLSAVEQVLDVPAAWLAFGGARTARRGVKAMAAAIGGPLGSLVDDQAWAGAVRAAASPVSSMTGGAGFAGEDIMLEVVQALGRAQPHESPDLTERDLANLASRLSFAVAGILGALRRDAPGTVLAGATLGVLAAVLAYVPAKGEGRPVTEVTGLLPTPPKARRGDSNV